MVMVGGRIIEWINSHIGGRQDAIAAPDPTLAATSQSVVGRGLARVTALDGLRGLAALIVVVHHSFSTSPALANAFLGSAGRLDTWSGS